MWPRQRRARAAHACNQARLDALGSGGLACGRDVAAGAGAVLVAAPALAAASAGQGWQLISLSCGRPDCERHSRHAPMHDADDLALATIKQFRTRRFCASRLMHALSTWCRLPIELMRNRTAPNSSRVRPEHSQLQAFAPQPLVTAMHAAAPSPRAATAPLCAVPSLAYILTLPLNAACIIMHSHHHHHPQRRSAPPSTSSSTPRRSCWRAASVGASVCVTGRAPPATSPPPRRAACRPCRPTRGRW